MFFEELEDVPPEEAHERRMSVRRTRVPLSGDTLGSTVASGSGLRNSKGPSDWQEEQREWEKSAEAMMEGATADPGGTEGSGLEITETETGPRNSRHVRSHPQAATRDSVGDRRLSRQPGDETTMNHIRRDAVNQSTRKDDPPPSNWRKFLCWVLTLKVLSNLLSPPTFSQSLVK